MAPADSGDFPKYGSIEAPAAYQARKALPPELQLSLQDILYELCVDPQRYPDRMASFSRDGSIQTYSHPAPSIDITIEIVEDESKIYILQYAAPLGVKKTVFISYSHDDNEWLDRVRKSLKLLERKGLIDIWDDSAIKPGDKWHEEIDKALRKSKVAVLLVSQNFAASDFILDEELPYILKSAQLQSVLLLWIAISSAPYDDIGVGEFQALNDPSLPLDSLDAGACNQELTKIYDKIKAAVTG
jgi:hypothetical protein